MTKKEKCSLTQTGRVIIHYNEIEKRIYPEELDKYLAEGWETGFSQDRKLKISAAHKGKTIWNSGLTKENDIRVNNISKKLTGITRGTSWNKDLNVEDFRVYNATKKATETKIKKYGNGFGPSNSMNEEHKAKISKSKKGKSFKLSPEKLKIKLSKDYITKKKNNTFNTSKPEEKLYEELLKENVNKTIYRQYKDPERYPYYCDFYIVEDDLFIELNAHWSHGGHPFDQTNKDDIIKLDEWKEKAKTSKFYEVAIYTWTIRDVEKANCARAHNLNYKVIY